MQFLRLQIAPKLYLIELNFVMREDEHGEREHLFVSDATRRVAQGFPEVLRKYCSDFGTLYVRGHADCRGTGKETETVCRMDAFIGVYRGF
jgi:hypothetical protein